MPQAIPVLFKELTYKCACLRTSALAKLKSIPLICIKHFVFPEPINLKTESWQTNAKVVNTVDTFCISVSCQMEKGGSDNHVIEREELNTIPHEGKTFDNLHVWNLL